MFRSTDFLVNDVTLLRMRTCPNRKNNGAIRLIGACFYLLVIHFLLTVSEIFRLEIPKVHVLTFGVFEYL